MAAPSTPDPLACIWAVVPLRGLESAKTRLAPELDAEERLELVIEMATRTLVACRDAAGLAGTVLVTLDPAAARLAESLGARTLVQRIAGLNAAIREARTVAIRAGATAMLVLPIDLPLISPAAIERVLGAAHEALRLESPLRGIVAVVPDRHGSGTNVLLVGPARAIDPAFGPDSHRLHHEATLAAGLAWLDLDGPLTFDIDTAADLVAAETASATRSGPDA